MLLDDEQVNSIEDYQAELEAIKRRHVEVDGFPNTLSTQCYTCRISWPCDTAVVLGALDDEREYAKSQKTLIDKWSARASALDNIVWNHLVEIQSQVNEAIRKQQTLP